MKLRSLTLCCIATAAVGLSGCVIAPPYGYVNARVSVPGPVVGPAPVMVYPAPYGYWGYGRGGYRR